MFFYYYYNANYFYFLLLSFQEKENPENRRKVAAVCEKSAFKSRKFACKVSFILSAAAALRKRSVTNRAVQGRTRAETAFLRFKNTQTLTPQSTN